MLAQSGNVPCEGDVEMDLITMSPKEVNRLEVIQRVQEKRMTRKAAAELLGISERQVKRLVHRYREQGASGLISKQRGKPSSHQLAEETKRKVLDLLKGKYKGFGPTLACEKMVEVEGVKISDESVRKMMTEGLWNAKKAWKLEVYQMRERRAIDGELEQMDGMDHDWFEGRGERCTLLVTIDDATGKLWAWMSPTLPLLRRKARSSAPIAGSRTASSAPVP